MVFGDRFVGLCQFSDDLVGELVNRLLLLAKVSVGQSSHHVRSIELNPIPKHPLGRVSVKCPIDPLRMLRLLQRWNMRCTIRLLK